MIDKTTRAQCRKSGLFTWINAFLRDRRGNVAMIFGLAAIPFFAFGGLAVDFSRAMMMKNRLGDALDATALAIGGQLGLSEEEVTASANAYFKANYPDSALGATSNLDITYAQAYVTISASATVDTLIVGLIGHDTMTVSSSVEVRREMRGLEVALVLDTTGSMSSGTKMPSLKAAANDLVSILFGTQDFPEKLRLGIVPFAAAVKLPSPLDAINKGWIDTGGLSSTARTYYSNNRFAYDIFAPLTGVRQSHQMRAGRTWPGCVEARPGGLEATDTPPTASNPDTRWVPYMNPDEPDNSSSANSYLTDSSTTSWTARLQHPGKYANANTTGQNRGCGMQPILPLTNDRDAIIARINALNPDGYTHIPIGLGWGWRVLSPNEPFSGGVAYNDPETNKALILMTDGVNTIESQSNANLRSAYSAYGYLYSARLGSTNNATAVSNMNAQVTTLCNAIKAPAVNIRVYTILLEETNSTVRSLLRNCATDPSLFYDNVSASQLRQVFRVIGADLSNLRLAR